MKISYNKLFNILEQRNITKTELRENIKISTATLAKLSKNELIAMKVIEDICNFLNCQPGDIMEMEKEIDKTTLLYRLQEGRFCAGWQVGRVPLYGNNEKGAFG